MATNTIFRVMQLTSDYIVTPVLKVKNAVVDFVNLFVPSQVYEIVHVNTEASEVTTVHSRTNIWFRPHIPLNLHETGYYFIRTWDGLTRQERNYFFSAAHLRDALGVKTLSTLWTMHDYGIQSMLRGHLLYSSYWRAVFGIVDQHGDDYAKDVHDLDLTTCLDMENNITPKALTLLLKYLGCMDPHGEAKITTVIDYNLNERTVGEDEYIIAKNDKSKNDNQQVRANATLDGTS